MVRSGGLVGPVVSAASLIGHGRRRRHTQKKSSRLGKKAKRVVSVALHLPVMKRKRVRRRKH